jgi:hypothetical protein
MDEEGFKKFLKRGGRTQRVLIKYVTLAKEFEQYLRKNKGKELEKAVHEELEDFAASVEENPKMSAKTYLLAIWYYYQFVPNEEMKSAANTLREQRIEPVAFQLKDFKSINPEHVKALAALGINNVNQMIKAGKTHENRKELSKKSGVPIEFILELVKLSDLSRIPGVKGIRGRLYYDAGVDTVEKMAQWEPEELRKMIVEFIDRTGFEGVPVFPKEAQYTIATARNLPKIIEY